MLTTELSLVMPLILALFVLAVFASRVQQQNTVVQGAADAAARAASLHLDPDAAIAAAKVAADTNKGGCESIEISEFAWPVIDPFTPGIVTVEVVCVESLDDLGAVTRGEREVRAVGSAAVEFWRPNS